MLYSSLSTNKICTTLFWSNTLSFFWNGQTKLVKECFNSQMFCVVSQTKSFSMSKCINPWVDEVTCSSKNLISSLNRLFDVLIKICLYLSFSAALSFLQFIRCFYLQQYLPVSMPALTFTFKILVQSQNHAILELLIGTLCCKTGWKVMLRVLSPTF